MNLLYMPGENSMKYAKIIEQKRDWLEWNIFLCKCLVFVSWRNWGPNKLKQRGTSTDDICYKAIPFLALNLHKHLVMNIIHPWNRSSVTWQWISRSLATTELKIQAWAVMRIIRIKQTNKKTICTELLVYV